MDELSLDTFPPLAFQQSPWHSGLHKIAVCFLEAPVQTERKHNQIQNRLFLLLGLLQVQRETLIQKIKWKLRKTSDVILRSPRACTRAHTLTHACTCIESSLSTDSKKVLKMLYIIYIFFKVCASVSKKMRRRIEIQKK